MAGRKQKAKPEEVVTLASLLGMEDDSIPVPVEEVGPKKLTPFDFLGAITYSKEALIVDDDTEKQYVPFIVNRGLANSQDTVIWANEMNSRPHIPNLGQFVFLSKSITRRKRYDKWIKAEEVENLQLVMDYYGYSREKAETALSILTPEQLDYISKRSFKGGRV